MKQHSIEAGELIDQRSSFDVIDVRTPSEYNQGHIPGAFNIPLFSDEERALIGTLYKQVSPQKAFMEGLGIAGPKMGLYVEQLKSRVPISNKKLSVHCWRGGQRSASISWLYNFSGRPNRVLEGGYKAYRRFAMGYFEQWRGHMIVVGGHTGAGKSMVLKALKEAGQQVIDLEKLANHKGSAFGSLGQEPQPTVKQFENDLFTDLCKLDPNQPIWIENESKGIGKVYIPDTIWRTMKNSRLFHLELPFEKRVTHLVDQYSQFSTEELVNSFENIRKRLGGQHLKVAIECVKQNEFEKAAAVALKYYDKAYNYNLKNNTSPDIKVINLNNIEPEKTASQLIHLASKQLIDG